MFIEIYRYMYYSFYQEVDFIMKTAIKRQGNSRVLIIPAAVLEKLGWSEGTAVDLSIVDGSLIAHPLAPSLETMLASVPRDFKEPEEDWGADAGKEGEA